MFAISPTDKNWFDYLRANQLNSLVNFWTPTPWNIKLVQQRDRWHFLLKSPIRKIAGFGEFVEYKNLTTYEAWNKFGHRNGMSTKMELMQKVELYVSKHSRLKTPDISSHVIGCIILKNCQFWENSDWMVPEEANITFKSQIVKYKYFAEENLNFQLLNEPREDYKREVNQRRGQGVFKGLILKAYDNKCCISGELCPELLEAAHIQAYINSQSNHVQNGLLLRVDLHRLFDHDLLFIDDEYTVNISSIIKDKIYRKFHGRKITLPSNQQNYPSKKSLMLKKSNFRDLL